jgi:hypothetical protein
MRVQKPQFHSIVERLKRVVRKSRWLSRAVLVALLAMFCLAAPTESQQPAEAIVIAGQRFELGMPKDAALANLAECCKLDGSGDSFTIEPKQPPYEMLGGVWFAGGKVVRLSLNDGQYQEQESVNLGQTLYGLLSELSHSEIKRATLQGGGVEVRGKVTRSEEEAVLLQISEVESGTMTIRMFSLRFRNGRRVVLEIYKPDANPKAARKVSDWVDVSEVLEKPQMTVRKTARP